MERQIASSLLSIGAVFLRPEQPFTWASGIKSPIYCDNRLTLSAPRVREQVENGLAKLVKRYYPDCEMLMGTSTAGIAHAAITATILDLPRKVKAAPGDVEVLKEAKRMGFGDQFIGELWGWTEADVIRLRFANDIVPVYKMIDSCCAEHDTYVPYFYSTYEQENESIPSNRKKILVLGSGPIRIPNTL